MRRKPDFTGWATKNDVRCADGRTIRKNAFSSQDGKKVPLIYNHEHGDPDMILGHAVLFNKDEGVWTEGYLNDGPKAASIKEALAHGDVDALSIYANQLVERSGDVLHGVIREVSLVLAGANPEALIEEAMLAHGDLISDDVLVAVCSDCSLSHADFKKKATNNKDDEAEDDNADEDEDEADEDEDMKDKNKTKRPNAEDDKTVGDVLKTLNEEQKKAVAVLLDAVAKNDNGDDDNDDEEDDADMKHNVFETDNEKNAMMHDALNGLLEGAKKSSTGSVKEMYLAHAAEYGIDGIDWLFPDAKNINGNGAPEFIKRQPNDWVNIVLNGVHHTPYSRVKMMFADITGDDARAKGYAKKGKYKTEEVFGLLKRAVEPTTVYKKQKFDRDDIIDITDFEVIPWVKAEMRMMLDEEIARAILFGDGRSSASPDKIRPDRIIPIVDDQNLFRYEVTITQEQGESYEHAYIRTTIEAQDDYEGSGDTILFVPQKTVTKLLLLEDGIGHRLYKTMDELALGLAVNRIVKVPEGIVPEGIVGVIVDLKDYNVGADKGGAVEMFDDFDINFNQQITLIETRCSGALTRPFSAIVLKTA